ncbi:MAG TPA: hypothetical protein VJA85_02995 [Candidatus Limnocylindria bacterium]|nr:hypothetical protein [Candidatus Limnocylindria bacterium]
MTDEPLVEPEPPAPSIIDLVPDDLALARGQLASGLPTLAESVLRRRIARIEAEGRGGVEELDAARSMLGEALWRQGRPLAAGAALAGVRAVSLERQRPIFAMIEAEALASSGHPDQADTLAQQVVAALGVDEAWRLRAGTPSRIAWPPPAALRTLDRTEADVRASEAAAGSTGSVPDPAQTAAAHASLERARVAYREANLPDADRHLALAVRLDPRLAEDGIDLVERTLGEEPAAERLLLFGDLLKAAGRGAEAAAAYSRAAQA